MKWGLFKFFLKGTGRNVLPLETQLLRCHQQAAYNTLSSVSLRVISSHSKYTAKQGAAFLTCRNYTWIATKFWRALSFSKGFYVISLKPSTQTFLWMNLAFHSRVHQLHTQSPSYLQTQSLFTALQTARVYQKNFTGFFPWYFWENVCTRYNIQRKIWPLQMFT